MLRSVLVVAMNRDEPDKPIFGRSDAEGIVTFRLTRKGPWLVKAVHMLRAPMGTDVQWISHWASLTFERP